jgi:REP element-mobilizing transposase RayT
MGNSFTNLVFHVVFSTKDRIPLIKDEFRERLYKYIGGIIRGQRGTLLEIGGMPDHVHLLARFRASTSVSTMVRFIKCNSSLWRNDQSDCTERFGWQVGYGAFSVSESQISRIQTYIRRQEEHHARANFKDELTMLLRKNGLRFEEHHLL